MQTIDFANHICKFCEYFCKNRRSLGNHLRRSHKDCDIQKYILKFYLNNKVPICKCGCKQKVSWHKTKYKYNDYISGHNYEKDGFSSINQPNISKEKRSKLNKKRIENRKEKNKNLSINEEKIIHPLNPLECQICFKRFSNKNGLAGHIGSFHTISMPKYVSLIYFNGEIPTCHSCKKETRYLEGLYSFQKFCIEHANSARSEWSKNNQTFDYGWRRGLTKETSLSIKKHSEKMSGNNNPMHDKRHSPEMYKHISNLRREKLLLKEEDFLKRKEKVLLIKNIEIISSYEFFRENGGIRAELDVLCRTCNTRQAKTFFAITDYGACINCKKNFSYSIKEKEITSFVKDELLFDIEENSRNILNGKELDIYVPARKFAIEYNGLYWHCENFKGKSDHLLKTETCQRKDIKLMHVFADEWEFQQEIIKSMIKNALGVNENRIFARKCKVEHVSQIEEKDFFNRTHLAGYKPSKLSLGLIYNGDIVSVASFREPWNKSNKYEKCLEVARFSNELDSCVIGGFSKLLKHAETWAKEKGYEKFLSYADRRFSEGDLYEKTGFTKTGETNINYWFTDFTERFNEHSFRLKKNKHKKEGLKKIYGCGNLIFEKEINKPISPFLKQYFP